MAGCCADMASGGSLPGVVASREKSACDSTGPATWTVSQGTEPRRFSLRDAPALRADVESCACLGSVLDEPELPVAARGGRGVGEDGAVRARAQRRWPLGHSQACLPQGACLQTPTVRSRVSWGICAWTAGVQAPAFSLTWG